MGRKAEGWLRRAEFILTIVAIVVVLAVVAWRQLFGG